MLCEKCGAHIKDGAKFCMECGTIVDPNIKRCKYCGAELPIEAIFCGECGKPLNEDQTIATKNKVEFSTIIDNSKSSLNINKKVIIGIAIGAAIVVVCIIAGILIFSKNDNPMNYQVNQDTKDINENPDYDVGSKTKKNTKKIPGNANKSSAFTESGSDVLRISHSGFSYDSGVTNCGYIVHNKTKKRIKADVRLRITAKNSKGKILDSQETTFPVFLRDYGFSGYCYTLSTKSKPKTIEYKFIDVKSSEYPLMKKFKIPKILIVKGQHGSSTVTGELVNNNYISFDNVDIYIIFKDNSNKISGGVTKKLSNIKAKKSIAFSVNANNKFVKENYDIYAVGYKN